MLAKKRILLGLLLGLAALASGGCGTKTQVPAPGSDDLPGVPSTSTGEVLFFDDFSDPSSGWSHDDTYYFRGYEDGMYRFRVDQDENQYVLLTAVSGQSYSDVRVEVDFERVSGADGAGIFLICRYQDNDNYYYAELEGDGMLEISAFIEDEQVVLIDDFDTGVIPARNHFRLDCVGTEMKIFIDGIQILSAAPMKIPQGDVGVGAGGTGSGLTDVRFDNFSVRAP